MSSNSNHKKSALESAKQLNFKFIISNNLKNK